MQQWDGTILEGKKATIYYGSDTFRSVKSMSSDKHLQQVSDINQHPTCKWYPEAQFCYRTNRDGLFFAAKGGHNNESHNHNDVGTFLLYADNKPLLIDAGVGTYTKKTFSPERYTIWTMQTNYHNLPLINGYAQQFGREFKATNPQCNAKKSTFSLDIASAYPAEAGIDSYNRQYTLKGKTLIINDAYRLNEVKADNQLVFHTAVSPTHTAYVKLLISIDSI